MVKSIGKKEFYMISNETATQLKGAGFLRQKDKEHLAVRVVTRAGRVPAGQMAALNDIAQKYGVGDLCLTQRGCLEIPGIREEDVEAVKAAITAAGLRYGGTGKRVRPVVSCKGTYCTFGQIDTQALCNQLDDAFFPSELPHKFKINVCGCPNNCAKVQLNDVGIMPHGKENFKLFIGGRAGRAIQVGEQCEQLVPAGQLMDAVAKIMAFFKANGRDKERLSQMIARLREENPAFKVDEMLR